MIKFILLLNILNASVSLIFYTEPFSKSFLTFGLIVFAINVTYFMRNLVMFLRVLFLGSPAVLAVVTKLLNEEGIFGFHLIESQTTEIVQILAILCNLGICGAVIGFCIVSQTVRCKHKIYPEKNLQLKFILFFLIFSLASWLLIKTRGESILSVAYGMQEASLNTGLGNLNSIAIISLLVMYFYAIRLSSQALDGEYQRYILFSHCASLFFIFYVCLLRGARMDALAALISVFVFLKLSRGEPLRMYFKHFVIGGLLFLILQMVGGLRSVLANAQYSELVSNMSRVMRNLVQEKGSGIIFYQGTINDLTSGISGIIYLVREQHFELLYGSSYLDYIERIPPAFIHPDRPKDLAWIFHDNGYTSGGGFHELAEAYYNFGLLGAFFIPMAITILIVSCVLKYQRSNSQSYQSNNHHLFHWLLLIGLLSSLLRGVSYQSFALFKTVVTAYILWFCVVSVVNFLNFASKDKRT